LKGPAAADDSIQNQEYVIGWISFAYDDLVPMVTDRAAPKGNNGALHQFLVVDLQKRASNWCLYDSLVEVLAQRRAGPLDHLEVGHLFPQWFGLTGFKG
jgi:hypothetical protein